MVNVSGAGAQDADGTSPELNGECAKAPAPAPLDPGGWGPMWEEDALAEGEVLLPSVRIVPRFDDELWLEVHVGLIDADEQVTASGPLYAAFSAETYADLALPDAIDGRFVPVDVHVTAVRPETGAVASRRALHALAYRDADGVVRLVTEERAAGLAGIAGVVAEDGTAEDGAAGLEVSR